MSEKNVEKVSAKDSAKSVLSSFDGEWKMKDLMVEVRKTFPDIKDGPIRAAVRELAKKYGNRRNTTWVF